MVGSIELVLWLLVTGTFSFFPRLNFPSETRILLLYLTVHDLLFKFMSLGNI